MSYRCYNENLYYSSIKRISKPTKKSKKTRTSSPVLLPTKSQIINKTRANLVQLLRKGRVVESIRRIYSPVKHSALFIFKDVKKNGKAYKPTTRLLNEAPQRKIFDSIFAQRG